MYVFDKIVEITDFLWGTPLTILVICVGLYMCKLCNFFQITEFKTIWNNTIKKLFKRKNKEGDEQKKTIATVLARNYWNTVTLQELHRL